MQYMSEKEYEQRLKQIKAKNVSRQRRQSLKNEEDKYKQQIKLPSTSKLMAAYLFVVLNIVLAFAMISMWHFADLSYLGVLITDVAAQVLTYFIYTKKATIENTKGGITYDIAMKPDNETIFNDSNAVG